MLEKRRTPRIDISLPIAFSYNGKTIRGNTSNISREGMFILTDTVLPVDAEIALFFQLPDDAEMMQVDSRVAWTKMVSSKAPAGMGIAFIRMSYEHRKKITDFLKQQMEWQPLAPDRKHAAESPA